MVARDITEESHVNRSRSEGGNTSQPLPTVSRSITEHGKGEGATPTAVTKLGTPPSPGSVENSWG